MHASMHRRVLVTAFALLVALVALPVGAAKPRAPARLTLAATPRVDGTVTVVLSATATASVDTLDLVLDLGDGAPVRAHFAATPAGTTHSVERSVPARAADRARGAVRTTTRGRTLMSVIAAPAPAARLAPPRAVIDVPGIGRVAETGGAAP